MSMTMRTTFDGGAIMNAAGKAETRFLFKFGAYVRKTARNSIKPTSGTQPSPPGGAPFGHAQTNQAYKNFVAFAVDRKFPQSVVVGSAQASRSAGQVVPEKVEYGGDENVIVTDHGKRTLARVSYQARPAMRLAFHKAIEAALPGYIKNSLHES